MKNKFKNLILESPLFYSWSVGIRFEIGSSNMWIVDTKNRVNEQYFIEALNRAMAIFDFIFKDNDEIVFVYQQFSYGRRSIGKNNFYLQQIRNLADKEIEFSDVRESEDDDRFEKKAYCLKRFAVKVSKQDINHQAILGACINSDFTIRNKRFIPHGDCYFINTSNHSILHLYDDRGMDVISIHPNNLKALYKKYNEWILDYDRERIDAIFKTDG
jgi:hypothetical protein